MQNTARENQYRVNSSPFPNPSSGDNIRKAQLRRIIEGAEDLRRVAADPEAENKVEKNRQKKILKKPPQKLGRA